MFALVTVREGRRLRAAFSEEGGFVRAEVCCPRRGRERAAALLRRAGVDRAAFAGDFELPLRQPDVFALYRRLAAEIVLRALEARGLSPSESVVVPVGARLCADMERAVVRLCGEVKNLAPCVSFGQEELCAALRKSRGLSPLEPSALKRLNEKCAVALFSDMAGVPEIDGAVYVPLSPDAAVPRGALSVSSVELSARGLPEGFDAAQILAELVSLGRLSPGEIFVETIKFSRKT